MKKQKALVILSGGQDSVTCLFWALANYDEVEAITFMYGQNHKVEVDLASQVCQDHGVHWVFAKIDFYAGLIESALTSKGDVNVLNEKGLPASFVPNRNALFITIAHGYAQKIGAQALVAGMCQTDFSGYPDCRQGFINQIQSALNIGSNSIIRIETPLMNLTKAQTFKLAKELGKLDYIILNTNTCYNGDRTRRHIWGFGCGKCPACILRREGFEEFAVNA